MANLRIEYVRLDRSGQVLEILGDGETLAVSGTSAQAAAPAFGVVAGAGVMPEVHARLVAVDQAVAVAVGANPTATAADGLRVTPGRPELVRVPEGQRLAAIAADGPAGAAVTGAALPAALAVTIANGASLTDAIDLADTRLSRIAIPASWTTANLSFQVSYDGVTYNNLHDLAGVEVTAAAAASRSISLHTLFALFQDVRWLKIRSGTSGTPVNQGGDRTLQLAVRSI
jgi:hypothetical protein